MSDITTISRPYAKAIFNHALDANELATWSAILYDLAQAVLNPEAEQFIINPSSTAELQSQLLLAIFAKNDQLSKKDSLINFVNLLAENKRLLALPDVYTQFEALRAEQEKTLAVKVSSFSSLTNAQQKHLIETLSQRLRRQVTLEVSIDKSLLGGAVIRAGDLVIDGSVLGKLHKLGAELAA